MKMDSTRRYEVLRERVGNGNVDRRSFMRLLGFAGLAAGVSGGVMTGLSRRALAGGTEIYFEGWGGVVSEALRKYAFDPYEKKTGNTVVDSTFGGEAEVLTKVRAAGSAKGHNVLHSSGVDWYKRWVDAGYGTKLNEANIPNLANVMAAIIKPFHAITPGYLSAVPYDYGTTGIAYNTEHVSKEKAEKLGANLLLDKSLKGKIGGWGGDWANRAWYGALQSGQDPNNITDWDAVWAKVREHRALVLKYWSSGAELMDLLAKGEIWVTEAWSGRVAALQAQGHPIGYFDPKNGLAWMESMFVLKGSPMAEAEELLNFMLAPETAIAVAEGQKYPSSLDPEKVKMTKIIEGLPAYDPTGKLAGLVFRDPSKWNPVEKKERKMWDRIKKGA
ncbi:spermidine/putrescine transport system substrate-binding protein [Tistlia consotensis]|uniref:Spermidine/putrescine transport system substrate-binding protein n=1 Tax=Tistlia consotensis USBA 355 TaxID=560819 RepID=A0A1Y6CB86_9PROT|nr:extracellular solute-binding protein [Tistlia consotensis]SMF46271.1 spermidine/putrescine transport system substrate-binding protein [Tistlia consotensis USBA 355]SNR78671.1 spermidine/putrescine transport system substrate-binding protein [Tistlia consotensis]